MSMLDTVRDYAQSHPVTMAAGLIIALPGTYLYITARSIPCIMAGLCHDSFPSFPQSHSAHSASPSAAYGPQLPPKAPVRLPTSCWSQNPASLSVVQMLGEAPANLASFLTAACRRLRFDATFMRDYLEHGWITDYCFARFAFVAMTTALPGVSLVLVRSHPQSWVASHRTALSAALHAIALITVADRTISFQDLLVAAVVMVSFGVLGRPSRPVDETCLGSAVETSVSSTHSVLAPSHAEQGRRESVDVEERGATVVPCLDEKDEEVHGLQQTLEEVRTAERCKDTEVKQLQTELRTARETMQETFSEYSSLRNELKSTKQTIGRDHQAIIYRKDIELFALRKANEQKESFLKEKDARLDTLIKQHKATLEVKESHMQSLKDRVASLERRDPSGQGNADTSIAVDGEHQAAMQVKLLRIKGRSSQEAERTPDEKDEEIARLKDDLAVIKAGSETLSRVQHELRRAWDATHEMQKALHEERELHAQSRSKLQETAIRLDEEMRKNSQKNSPTRLPTIEESNKQELEAMFNAAQQDNLRLYAEHEALEKRLREANARVFSTEEELDALQEQLRLEKAINDDMETARPSVVHRVHFQRMEGQLKECHEAIVAKDDEIARLQASLEAKSNELDAHTKAKQDADNTLERMKAKVEQMQKSVAELESTKEQLMLDHERLAQHRARNRTSSAEHTSARSSSATLITDPNMHPMASHDVPLPPRPLTVATDGSIQGTPERMLRTPSPLRIDTSVASPGNRISLISNDLPPPEIRNHSRRKSLTLKSLMRKVTGKDQHEAREPKGNANGERTDTPHSRPRSALMPKDKNALLRPRTAVAQGALNQQKFHGNGKQVLRPRTSAAIPAPTSASVPTDDLSSTAGAADKHAQTVRLIDATPASSLATVSTVASPTPNQKPKPVRYHSNGGLDGSVRPKTALEEKEEREYGALGGRNGGERHDAGRPKSRGWSMNMTGRRKRGEEGASTRRLRKSIA